MDEQSPRTEPQQIEPQQKKSQDTEYQYKPRQVTKDPDREFRLGE